MKPRILGVFLFFVVSIQVSLGSTVGIASVYAFKDLRLSCQAEGIQLSLDAPGTLLALGANFMTMRLTSSQFDSTTGLESGISQEAPLLMEEDSTTLFSWKFQDSQDYFYEFTFPRQEIFEAANQLTENVVKAKLMRVNPSRKAANHFDLNCNLTVESRLLVGDIGPSPLFQRLSRFEKMAALTGTIRGMQTAALMSQEKNFDPDRQNLVAAIIRESNFLDVKDSKVLASIPSEQRTVIEKLREEIVIQHQALQAEWLAKMGPLNQEQQEWVEDHGWHLNIYAVIGKDGGLLGVTASFNLDQGTNNYDDDSGLEIFYGADQFVLGTTENFPEAF